MRNGTTPAAEDLTAEERDELYAVYLTIPSLHHISFSLTLQDSATRICLWNVAHARRKTRARKTAAVDVFELTP